ncbi:hypothetical protein RhiJN_17039 [Ceratobasidium sp. AG-Ba]|nr:hypothetical protein RhiJN_17039 [Ceratobasidium sp. AG-Ba]
MPIASTPRTCPMTLLSSLSSCASGVYSIKLVDLLLAAHPQVTGREVDFTLLLIDAVIYQSDRPYAALPADLIRKAAHSPDLVRALVSTPDTELGSDAGDIGLAFERLSLHPELSPAGGRVPDPMPKGAHGEACTVSLGDGAHGVGGEGDSSGRGASASNSVWTGGVDVDVEIQVEETTSCSQVEDRCRWMEKR